MFTVRVTHPDGTQTYVGKESWDLNNKEVSWIGEENQALGKVRYLTRERTTKPNKSLTFTKLEVVPVTITCGEPREDRVTRFE